MKNNDGTLQVTFGKQKTKNSFKMMSQLVLKEDDEKSNSCQIDYLFDNKDKIDNDSMKNKDFQKQQKKQQKVLKQATLNADVVITNNGTNAKYKEKHLHQTIQIPQQRTVTKKQNKNKKSYKQQLQQQISQNPQQENHQNNNSQQESKQIEQKLDEKVQVYHINQSQQQNKKGTNDDNDDESGDKKKDKQEIVIRNLNGNLSKLNKSLNQLKEDYIDLNQDEIMFRKNNRIKQVEIREFLVKKKHQKEIRRKKLQNHRKKEQAKASQTIQMAQIQRSKIKQEKLKQRKYKEYVEPKQRRQKLKQQEREKLEQVKQYYKMAKNKKSQQPFHIKKQREDEQIMQRQKQRQEAMLSQRRKKYETIVQNDLFQHRRRYESKLQELENQKRQIRLFQIKKIQKENKQVGSKRWRGNSHDFVQEELNQLKNKKVQSQRRMKALKSYSQRVKKAFAPKISRSNDMSNFMSNFSQNQVTQSLERDSFRYNIAPEQIIAQYNPNKKIVKKYKFKNGSSIGQAYESIPVSKSHEEQKIIGKSYLEHMRRLPKKQTEEHSIDDMIDSADLELLNKKFNSISKVKRQSIPFYGGSVRQKKISLSARPSNDEVRMIHEQLKNQDSKLKSKRQLIRVLRHTSSVSQSQEREIDANFVKNMERKLDLLSNL